MLYPKFPRRTLALILFCMVITLGAVGSIFLIYFFNENSTPLFDTPLKSIYVDDKPIQQYRQNLLEKNDFKTDQELLSIYSNYVENDQIRIENNTNSTPKVQQDFDTNVDRKKPAVSTRKTINSKGQKDMYGSSSSDTIYIDDFDRPTYSSSSSSSKSRGELGTIDYFDTILVDHKVVDTSNAGPSPTADKLDSVRLEEAVPSIIYKTRIISEASSDTLANESELKPSPRINNKRRWDKNKALFKLRKDDEDVDAYDSEIETAAGSGSGDFFDDTEEVNEVFIKQLNSRANKKEKPFRKSYKMKSMMRNKKHRLFSRYGNKFISSSPTFSTMSSSDEDDIRSNWSYQKNSKKLISYPTNPTIQYSEPLSASGKKLLVPAVFNNNNNNINNGGSNNSPTSPYNDNFQLQLELSEIGATSSVKNSDSALTNSRDILGVGVGVASSSSNGGENNEAWIETRTRRIMGNVKKSEERSRQLLLCEEAGGGELCRMLFKGRIND